LGLLQLRDLFSGRIYEWNGVGRSGVGGAVEPVSREDGSATRVAFEMLVMEDFAVTPRALVAPSGASVVEYVSENRQAIGYVAMSQVNPGVKLIEIEGELPTPEAVGSASYPLTRELWLVMADPAPEHIQAFVEFALGPDGQQIAGKHFGPMR